MTGLSWEDDGAGEGLLTRRDSHKCMNDKEIDDFLFDRLSGVTREVIEEHLLVCQTCLDRVEEEEAYIAAVRSAADQVQREDLERALSAAAPPPQSWTARIRSLFSARPFQWAAAGTAVLVLAALLAPRPHGALTEAEIALQLDRGSARSMAEAPAGRSLTLDIDVAELADAPAFRIELVDSAGRVVQAADVVPSGGKLQWKTGLARPAGVYWVRLKDHSGPNALLREFGLRVGP